MAGGQTNLIIVLSRKWDFAHLTYLEFARNTSPVGRFKQRVQQDFGYCSGNKCGSGAVYSFKH